MLIRIIFQKLGLFKRSDAKWNLEKNIYDRVSDYKDNIDKKLTKPADGPMIKLHKLNKQEIAVNTGHVQVIEKMGENSIIVFTTGNRIVVMESSEVINKLIEESNKYK